MTVILSLHLFSRIVSQSFLYPVSNCLDRLLTLALDDPFVEGLKTCLISELLDEPPNPIPRPWVLLPPTHQTSQSDLSLEQDNALEANEILWLHEMLKELVNK